jgi:hypothetical protein
MDEFWNFYLLHWKNRRLNCRQPVAGPFDRVAFLPQTKVQDQYYIGRKANKM